MILSREPKSQLDFLGLGLASLQYSYDYVGSLEGGHPLTLVVCSLRSHC